MDAKVDIEILNNINEKIQECSLKLDDEISLIKNDQSFATSHFSGNQADIFCEKTQEACNSICAIISSLQQLYSFVNSLENAVTDYDNTKYLD